MLYNFPYESEVDFLMRKCIVRLLTPYEILEPSCLREWHKSLSSQYQVGGVGGEGWGVGGSIFQ